MLVGVIDLNYHGETGLLLHNGGKEEYVWNLGDPLGLLLVPFLELKSMENYNSLIQAGLLIAQVLHE